MIEYHIAQVNIGRTTAPLDDPLMAGFVTRLDEINALADASPGFVWRLQTSEGNATYFRPYDDDRILVNMSVWETIDSLRHYVYRTAHVELLRQRHEWFDKFAGTNVALWWVPVGHLPVSMRRKSALPTWMHVVQRSSRLLSRRFFSPMKSSSKGLTGRLSGPVRRFSCAPQAPCWRRAASESGKPAARILAAARSMS